MIVTVTVNPSLDRTVEIDALVRGAVHRARGGRVDAGGKGVNIARALTANGYAARAVLPVGGPDGGELVRLLAEAAIDCRAVPIAGAVRTNVSVVEPDGTVTKFNAPGPVLSPSELAALVEATLAAAGDASWVACSGRLTPGADDATYADLVEALHRAACPVAVDSSGPALVAALAAGPDLVKPNAEELADAAGRPLATFGDVVAAAQNLRRAGARAVLASLGGDGSILVEESGAVHGHAPVDAVRSTVGAGDATLAGFLAAGGRGPKALREALAWGAAAVSLPGSRMPGPGDLDHDAVVIHDRIDADRPLDTKVSP